MRKAIITAIMVLALVGGFSTAGFADLDVNIGIGVPPPVVFSAPPEVVVIPGTYVYVVPGIAEDVFFLDGYWWRPWHGHWYRSRSYDRGWVFYDHAPAAVVGIPSDWRMEYREHRWGGYDWDYRPIPYHQVERNWRGWERDRHWDKPEYRQVAPGPRGGEVKPHYYRGSNTFEKQRTIERRRPATFEKQQTIEKRRPATFEKQQMKSRELRGRQSESRQFEGRQKERVKAKENQGRM